MPRPIVCITVVLATALALFGVGEASDGFVMREDGQRVPLSKTAARPMLRSQRRSAQQLKKQAPTLLVEEKEAGAAAAEPAAPAFKVARSLGIDSLKDETSFRERVATLESSTAGKQLLNRMALRLRAKGDGADGFVKLLQQLAESLETAAQESNGLWKKIGGTCNQAASASDRKISDLQRQIRVASADMERAQRKLQSAQQGLPRPAASLLSVRESAPAGHRMCAEGFCLRTSLGAAAGSSVECFNPQTGASTPPTAVGESQLLAYLDRQYHENQCSDDLSAPAPASPKAVVNKLLQRLGDATEGATAVPTARGGAAAAMKDLKGAASTAAASAAKSKAADAEARIAGARADADSAATELAALRTQVDSLHALLQQERLLKVHLIATCKAKAQHHADEQLARKDQLRAVKVAQQLVTGNIDGLRRYLQGERGPKQDDNATASAGLGKGESVVYVNPEAARLAEEDTKLRARLNREEKMKELGVFGENNPELLDDESAPPAPGPCGRLEKLCHGKCIAKEAECPASIVVQKSGDLTALQQGGKGALISTDPSEEWERKEKQMTSKQQLEYVNEREMREERRKKEQAAYKKKVEEQKQKQKDAKEKERDQLERLTKLQAKLKTAEEKLAAATTADDAAKKALQQVQDRAEELESDFRSKAMYVEKLRNQTNELKASKLEEVNKHRDNADEIQRALANAEDKLNASRASLAQLDASYKTLGDTSRDLDDRIKQAEHNLARADDRLTQLRNSGSQADISAAQEMREQYVQQKLELQEKSNTARQKLEKVTAEREAAQKENADAKRAAAKADYEASTSARAAEQAERHYKAEVKQVEADLEAASGEMARAKSRRDGTRTALDDAKVAADKAQMTFFDAKMEKVKIRDEYNALRTARNEQELVDAETLAPLPEQAPMIAYACKLYDTCIDCTADVRCGWAGQEMGCMRGHKNGPWFYNDTKSGALPTWSYQTCPEADCEQYTDCKQCLTAGCGFCGGMLACMSGDQLSPTVPSNCPQPFMRTYAFKSADMGTARCPVRQVQMTDQAEKEETAFKIAMKRYRAVDRISKLILQKTIERKNTPTSDPKHAQLGREIQELRGQYYEELQALNAAVGDMDEVSAGDGRTFKEGFAAGLKEAERKMEREKGYLMGLREGIEKAKTMRGPPGPAGPAGPTGPSGSSADANMEKVEKVVREDRDKFEKNSMSKAKELLVKAHQNYTALADKVRNLPADASAEEREALESELAASKSHLDRTKHTANTVLTLVTSGATGSATGAATGAAGDDLEQAEAEVGGTTEAPEAQQLENELETEDSEDEAMAANTTATATAAAEAEAGADESLSQRPAAESNDQAVEESDDEGVPMERPADAQAAATAMMLGVNNTLKLSPLFLDAQKSAMDAVKAIFSSANQTLARSVLKETTDCGAFKQMLQNQARLQAEKDQAYVKLDAEKAKRANALAVLDTVVNDLSVATEKLNTASKQAELSKQSLTEMKANSNDQEKITESENAWREAEASVVNAQAQVDALTKSRKQAEINKQNSTAQISAAENEATAKFKALQTIDSLLDGVNSTCSSSSQARIQAQQQFDTAEQNVQDLEVNQKQAREDKMKSLTADVRKLSFMLSLRGGFFADFGAGAFDSIQKATAVHLTIQCWVKLRSMDAEMTLLSASASANGEMYGWTLGTDAGGFVFRARQALSPDTVTTLQSAGSSNPVNVTSGWWYHVAVVSGPTSRQMFVNGKKVAFSSDNPGIVYSPASAAGAAAAVASRSFTIGAMPGGDKYLNGVIDDVAVWGRSLDDSEIGAWADASTAKKALATKVNEPGEQCAVYVNFGPDYVPSASITSIVTASPAVEGTIKQSSATIGAAGATASWVADDPAMSFDLPASTETRVLGRRLGESVLDLKVLGATETCPEACTGACTPTASSGVAMYLQPQLFGTATGKIPSSAFGKIVSAKLVLTVDPATCNGGAAEPFASTRWSVSAFAAPRANASAQCQTPWNPLRPGSTDTPIEGATVERAVNSTGKVELDITSLLRPLAEASRSKVRGLYLVGRTDGGSGFCTAAKQYRKSRPELLVTIFEGQSKPIRFVKTSVSSLSAAQLVCPADKTVCNMASVKRAFNIDGYGERSCGWTKEISSPMRAPEGDGYVHQLEACDNAEGVFCCRTAM